MSMQYAHIFSPSDACMQRLNTSFTCRCIQNTSFLLSCSSDLRISNEGVIIHSACMIDEKSNVQKKIAISVGRKIGLQYFETWKISLSTSHVNSIFASAYRPTIKSCAGKWAWNVHVTVKQLRRFKPWTVLTEIYTGCPNTAWFRRRFCSRERFHGFCKEEIKNNIGKSHVRKTGELSVKLFPVSIFPRNFKISTFNSYGKRLK